jgi:hypothetical protein
MSRPSFFRKGQGVFSARLHLHVVHACVGGAVSWRTSWEQWTACPVGHLHALLVACSPIPRGLAPDTVLTERQALTSASLPLPRQRFSTAALMRCRALTRTLFIPLIFGAGWLRISGRATDLQRFPVMRIRRRAGCHRR